MSNAAPAKPRSRGQAQGTINTAALDAAAAAVSAASSNGHGRNSAIVTELDFSDAVGASALPEAPAPTARITKTLAKLKTATLDGQVPSDDDGLMFVAVAKHTSASGAQTTLRNLQQNPARVPDGLDAWEFRRVPIVEPDGSSASHLRARYVGGQPALDLGDDAGEDDE